MLTCPLSAWFLLSDVHALWSVSIHLLESCLDCLPPENMSAYDHCYTFPSTFKYFSVKHVCFACFVPFNKSVFNSYFVGELEIGSHFKFTMPPFFYFCLSNFTSSLPSHQTS